MFLKKLLLPLLVLFACTANAQINKGAVLLGGNIAYSEVNYGEPSNQDQNDFIISPSVGFAYKTNRVAGVGINYGHSKVENQNSKTETESIGGFVYMRRYWQLGKSFYLFAEGNGGYLHSERIYRSKVTTDRQEQKTNGIQFGLYPGIAYALGKKIQLEAGLNNLVGLSIQNTRTKTTNPWTGNTSTKNSSVNFSMNLDGRAPLSLGFRFLLNK
jgi:hypothetical protein